MNGKVHPGGQPGPLTELLGCRLLNFDAMPPLVHSIRRRVIAVEIWAESYRIDHRHERCRLRRWPARWHERRRAQRQLPHHWRVEPVA